VLATASAQSNSEPAEPNASTSPLVVEPIERRRHALGAARTGRGDADEPGASAWRWYAARVIAAANLGVRFLLELAAVAAVVYWGWRIGGEGLVGLALGIALALALVLVWWRLIAPKARSPISTDMRPLVGSGILLLAAAALGLADQPLLALAMAIAVVVNTVVMYGAADGTPRPPTADG
jgi:hypothetical protein